MKILKAIACIYLALLSQAVIISLLLALHMPLEALTIATCPLALINLLLLLELTLKDQ